LQKVSKEFFNKVFKENSRGKKFESKNFIKKYIDDNIQKIKNEINILQKVLKEFFNKVFKENSRGKKI
jgi:hypothetical protein